MARSRDRQPQNLNEVVEMFPHLRKQVDALQRKARLSAGSSTSTIKPRKAPVKVVVRCLWCDGKGFRTYGQDDDGYTIADCWRCDKTFTYREDEDEIKYRSHPRYKRNDTAVSTAKKIGKKAGDLIGSLTGNVKPNQPKEEPKWTKVGRNGKTVRPKSKTTTPKVRSPNANKRRPRKTLSERKVEPQEQPNTPVDKGIQVDLNEVSRKLRAIAKKQAKNQKAREAKKAKAKPDLGKETSQPKIVEALNITEVIPDKPFRNPVTESVEIADLPNINVAQVIKTFPSNEEEYMTAVSDFRTQALAQPAEVASWMKTSEKILSSLPMRVQVRTPSGVMRAKRDLVTSRPYIHGYMEMCEMMEDFEFQHPREDIQNAAQMIAALRPLARSWARQRKMIQNQKKE